MMVSSRMVKPHIVKKWAMPGTVHLRSLRWPATSVTSASAWGGAAPGAVGGRLAGTDEARQPVEAAAGDDGGDDRNGQADGDPDWHGSSYESMSGVGVVLSRLRAARNHESQPQRWGRSLVEIVGVTARRRTPLALVLGTQAARAVGAVGRGGHAQEADLADLHSRVEGDG